MKRLIEDSLELLREMVRIPSLSFEEEAVCSHIMARLQQWGLEPVRERNNIILLNRDYDSSRKTLCLDAHIDTVPANNGYTRDPFDPGDDPETVWGLGSNDDGGSVVSMIAAFRHFYGKSLPFNLMLTLSSEEERSGDGGARWIYADDGPVAGGRLPRPDWVIVGEPTGMRAATSERGLLVIDGHAEGVSGHAARNEGVNALYKALDDIDRLRNFLFDRHSELMGDVKLTVTQIHAGTAHNVVPDGCDFVVDIRPTEQYTNSEILSMLQDCCQSRLVARNLTNHSSATLKGSPLLSTLDALGVEQFSSPTTSNWIRIPCDAVKMGPGDSCRSHRPDEFVRRSEIADAVGGYVKFIENFKYGNTLE